jgi:hypothetical protein
MPDMAPPGLWIAVDDLWYPLAGPEVKTGEDVRVGHLRVSRISANRWRRAPTASGRLDDLGRPTLTASRSGLAAQALYPGGVRAPARLAAGCPGCMTPSYALGFAPGGRALTVVLDKIFPNNSPVWTSHPAVTPRLRIVSRPRARGRPRPMRTARPLRSTVYDHG